MQQNGKSENDKLILRMEDIKIIDFVCFVLIP